MADSQYDRLKELEGDVRVLEQTASEYREKKVEWDIRFDNGRLAMGEIRLDLEKLKPSTPDWLKLLGMVAGIVISIIGLQTWIQDKLGDRVTRVELEQKMREHVDQGHAATSKNIADLRDLLIIQGEAIKTLKADVDKLEAAASATAKRARSVRSD